MRPVSRLSKLALTLACTFALVACGHGKPAAGASNAMKACADKSTKVIKTTIAACSTAIASGALKEADIDVAYRRRAYAYESLGDHQGALADLDLLLMRQPDNAKALAMRGYVQHQLWAFDQAIADFERSIRLDGGSEATFAHLGDAYFRIRDFTHAEASYGRDIDASRTRTWGWMHRCFARAVIGKDLDAALADCDQAMKLTASEPGSLPHVLGYRCFAQYRMQHYREALQDCDAAIAHDATLAAAYYMRGVTKQRLGDASGSDDIAKARKLDATIAERYAGFGAPETP